YSSNLRGLLTIGIATEQVAGHGMPKPPMSKVARTVWPAKPVVSTVILGVPCPLVMRPAVMVQLKAGVMPGVPPLNSAVKVTGSPSLVASGHETETLGQTG